MAANQDSDRQEELDHNIHQEGLDSNPDLVVVLALGKIDHRSTVAVIVPVVAVSDMGWETETFHTLTEPAFLASALHCSPGTEVVLMTWHILVSKSLEQTRVEVQRSAFQWMKSEHHRLPTATKIVWNLMNDEDRNLHSGFH